MPSAVSVEYSNHPPGTPHARSTVRKMADLARKGAHSYEIRNLATRIVAHVPSKQPVAELAALHIWVRENIKYRNDPHGLEWLQAPRRTIIERAGDCDDFAILLAAFAQTLGRPTRFEIVGNQPGRYKHTYVQAQLPTGEWITMDPVLEPPSDGRPRTDLGKFGHRAVGHRLTFNDRGHEVMGLHGATTAKDRQLWQTVPYFPQVPPTSGYASPADAGRRPEVDYRYRSAVVAGPTIAGPPRSGVMPYLSGLGHYSIVEGPQQGHVALGDAGELVMWDDALQGWGFLKKVGRAIGKVSKAVSKIPGVSMVASLVPGGSAILEAGKIVGQVSGKGRKRKAKVRARGRASRGKLRGRGVPRIGGRAARAAKVLRKRTKKTLRRSKKSLQRAKAELKRMRAAAKRSKRKSRVIRKKRRKARVIRKARSRAAAKSRVVRRARARREIKRPHPELAMKYPPDARQLYDTESKKFRIYLPTSGVSGVDGLCPPGWTAVPGGTRGALPPAEAWSKYSGVSGLDGLAACPTGYCPPGWKPVPRGTRGALPRAEAWSKWHKGQHSGQMLGAWRPTISFALGGGMGAVNPATSKAAARAAVEAVAAHIRGRGKGRPPGRAVAAVMGFQKTDPKVASGGRPGGLTVDGLWGLNSQIAAAYYLGVPASSLPPVLPVFKRKPPTWSPPPPPPVVVQPPAPKPAPRAPAPKPAPPHIITPAPVTIIKKPAAPPRIITKPPIVIAAPKLAPKPRVLETLKRRSPYESPPLVPWTFAPLPQVPAQVLQQRTAPPKPTFRTAPIVTMPPAKPAAPPTLRVVPGPVPPIPTGGGQNTAAPTGQYPTGAVYRDGSGNPRVSGYAEVGQEKKNPGMDPVGMSPPAPAPITPGPGAYTPADASDSYRIDVYDQDYPAGGEWDRPAGPAAASSDNTWLWLAIAYVMFQRRKGNQLGFGF